jgi:hypothetical protein
MVEITPILLQKPKLYFYGVMTDATPNMIVKKYVYLCVHNGSSVFKGLCRMKKPVDRFTITNLIIMTILVRSSKSMNYGKYLHTL